MDDIWGNTAQYTETYWPWPIALYLFLAGLSAGALIISVWLHRRDADTSDAYSWFVKGGALVAPVTVIIGLLLLVLDLSNPLNFYQLLFHWNLRSVMSIGTLLLVIYTPISILYALSVFRNELSGVKGVRVVANALDTTWLHYVGVVLAVGIGCYTGFLLSAMAAQPLFNVAVLPLLFLVSGLSAGISSVVIVGLLVTRNRACSRQLNFSCQVDTILMVLELVLLFLMFIGLYFQGGAHAQAGTTALTDPVWGTLFWVGVVGFGLVVPLVMHFFTGEQPAREAGGSASGRGVAVATVGGGLVTAGGGAPGVATSVAHRLPLLLASSSLVILGSLMLRLFIVYAGQLPA